SCRLLDFELIRCLDPPRSSVFSGSLLLRRINRYKMARGPAKLQSQQKNQKKKAEAMKSQAIDHKGAQLASLTIKCTVCMIQMVDMRSYKQHFENKHPKSPLPAELASA
ncbi:hypothetical protein PENTCL1PPCAC_4229, partial [Pristionchus entomophagus]